MIKNRFYTIMALVALYVLFPVLSWAETIDGGGEFDSLLLAILDLLNGPILTSALVISVVGFGITIALFPSNRETIERGARVVLGLLIAAKGAGFVANALGLSCLI